MIHFIPVLHSAFSMTKAPLMSLWYVARENAGRRMHDLHEMMDALALSKLQTAAGR